MRVYVDQTDLAANPHLWPTIERALRASRYLILLASPGAARSRWVQKEVAQWLSLGRAERLLIAITDGNATWDETEGDFDWNQSSALPPNLRGVFAHEPRMVDVRAFRETPELSLQNPDFHRATAVLAAPIRGLGLDALIDEDHREHRRTKRLVVAVVSALTLLALATTGAGLIALDRAETAEKELYRSRVALADREWLNGNAGRARDLLEACAPRRRRWEWRYLDRLTTRAHLTLSVGDAMVSSVAFSPSGKRLAAVDVEHNILVWRFPEGEALSSFRGVGSSPFGVTFGPQGLLFSTSPFGTVSVFDAENGEHRQPSFQPPGGRHVAVSEDGSRVATGSYQGWLRLSDARTGELVHEWQGHTAVVWSVAFSPTGDLLASAGGDGLVKIWRADDSSLVRILEGHDDVVNGVAFHPGGELLATGSWDRSVRIWEIETGALVRTLRGHQEAVRRVTFSKRDDLLVSGGDDYIVRLWNPVTGEQLRAFHGHEGWVTDVAAHPAGRWIASASLDGTVRVWDGTRDQRFDILRQATSISSANAHGGESTVVKAIEVDSESRILAEGRIDGPLVIWDLVTKKALFRWDSPVRALAFSPVQPLLAIGNEEELLVWNTESWGPPTILARLESGAHQVAFDLEGRLVSAGLDGLLSLWDPAAGDLLKRWAIPGDYRVSSLAFNAAGLLAVADAEGRIAIWNPWTGDQIKVWQGHDLEIYSLAFSPDGGLLATASADGHLKIWRGPRWEPYRDLEGDVERVFSVDFGPDGRLVSAGDERFVKIWDVEAGELILNLRGHRNTVDHAVFTSDGERLITSSWDGAIHVWSAPEPTGSARGATAPPRAGRDAR